MGIDNSITKSPKSLFNIKVDLFILIILMLSLRYENIYRKELFNYFQWIVDMDYTINLKNICGQLEKYLNHIQSCYKNSTYRSKKSRLRKGLHEFLYSNFTLYSVLLHNKDVIFQMLMCGIYSTSITLKKLLNKRSLSTILYRWSSISSVLIWNALLLSY